MKYMLILLCLLLSCHDSLEEPKSLGDDYFFFAEADGYNYIFKGHEIDPLSHRVDSIIFSLNIQIIDFNEDIIIATKSRLVDLSMLEWIAPRSRWSRERLERQKSFEVNMPCDICYFVIHKNNGSITGPLSKSEFDQQNFDN